ncbi:unnamed protein product, partial [Ectocarpus sp. 8 AP-2014]
MTKRKCNIKIFALCAANRNTHHSVVWRERFQHTSRKQPTQAFHTPPVAQKYEHGTGSAAGCEMNLGASHGTRLTLATFRPPAAAYACIGTQSRARLARAANGDPFRPDERALRRGARYLAPPVPGRLRRRRP